jgi:hypothetical protein
MRLWFTPPSTHNPLPSAHSAALLIVLSGCGFLPLTHTSRRGAQPIEAAPKPEPGDSSFDGCGAAGSQPDYALNRRKNRVDEGIYVAVPWTVIARLPWPHGVAYRFRNQWGAGETKSVARYEGAAVVIEGYLAGSRLEVPEPPNCYSRDPDQRDYHLWLSEKAHGHQRNSIVVEITPRVRAMHNGWTGKRLDTLVAEQRRVRVSGWLMLDQMHPEQIGITRTTLWEIHPIMHFEFESGGGWRELESGGS